VVSRVLEPVTVRLSDAIYCVSRYGAAKRVVQRHARQNLGQISNGIALRPLTGKDRKLRREFGFSEDEVVAICVTRLSLEKGLIYLAEAMRILEVEGCISPRLLIVGDGPNAKEIRSAFGTMLSSGRVVMPGKIDNAHLLCNAADFMVLPSLHEHQSFAILEAMMAGRAVLTTDVGGNSELVCDAVNGLLVPAKDARRLAAGMARLASSQELRERMGQAGRERAVREFSLENLVYRVEEIYDQMVAK